MARNLSGWQRLGVIVALLWFASIPFVVGPAARANSVACRAAEEFKLGGMYAGRQPGADNPNFDPMNPASGGATFPDPKPLICFNDGYEVFFDLRDYPFGAEMGGELAIVTIIALVILVAEGGISLLLVWAGARIVIGSVRWVRVGFGQTADGEAKG